MLTAIRQSIAQNEIVTIDYDEAAKHELTVSCDDSVRANEMIEFWGMDEAGSEWRVHMRYPDEDGNAIEES